MFLLERSPRSLVESKRSRISSVFGEFGWMGWVTVDFFLVLLKKVSPILYLTMVNVREF